MNLTYADNIIIGAGVSGLTLGGLLAKNQNEVLLLEAHALPGGCAGYFKKNEFVFDVGATTLSGINGLDALKRVITLLDLNLQLKHCDPGLVIHTDNYILNRYSNLDRWINEQKQIFSFKGLETFWEKVSSRNKELLRLIKYSENFPIKTAEDLKSLILGDYVTKLKSLAYITKTFSQLHPELNEIIEYKRIIDEMLLIAAQNFSHEVPALIGYLALSYLEDCWYCYGGMRELNHQLVNSIKLNKGEVQFNREVLEIRKKFNYFELTTSKGIYRAKHVYSSIPIWNTVKIASTLPIHKIKRFTSNFQAQWGAITGYFVIKSKTELFNLYHQIHIKIPISYTKSHSVFVSLSPLTDDKRNDGQQQTLTISVHIDLKNYQQARLEKTREELKSLWQSEFEKIITSTFSEVLDIKCYGIGDPITFEHYTRRFLGSVGGIAHNMDNLLLSYPNFDTGVKNFFQLGDTTFPGQGIVGVMQGSLNLFQRKMT
jgi:phytoene dehydrogenase-like protein